MSAPSGPFVDSTELPRRVPMQRASLFDDLVDQALEPIGRVLAGQNQLLEEILAELKHANSADRTGAVSSIAFEDLAKGEPKVTSKFYIGSPLTRADVDEALDIHAYAHREAARRQMEGWRETIEQLERERAS